MDVKKIEIQDENENVYYPHTDSSIVKYKNSIVENELDNINSQLNDLTNYKQDKIVDSGWNNLDLNDSTAGNVIPQYRKEGNNLSLTGRVKGIASEGGTIATLPDNFRPSVPKLYLCPTDVDGVYVRIIINSGGTITAPLNSSLNTTISIYLDSITNLKLD